MKIKDKVLYNSDKAAKKVDGISGWVDRYGKFFGDNEDLARYSGCTHRICDCGNEHEKMYTLCADCRWEKTVERYNNLPEKPYNGGPLCLYQSDVYFFNLEDLTDHLEDQNQTLADTMLVMCEPNYARQLDGEYWTDDCPEDQYIEDIIPEISELISAVNKAVEGQIVSWIGGKNRPVFDAETVKIVNPEKQDKEADKGRNQ